MKLAWNDFMGIIPDWELVVLFLFLAIFVLVCIMACLKCSQFSYETTNFYKECPTWDSADKLQMSRSASDYGSSKEAPNERTRLLSAVQNEDKKDWASFLLYFSHQNYTHFHRNFTNSAWTILQHLFTNVQLEI